MKKHSTIILILIILMKATLTMAMPPIPPEVKLSVGFIFVPSEDKQIVANGTGFFVGVKNAEKPEAYFVYLVTAKHVLQGRDKKTFYPFVLLRLNKKSGDTDMLALPLITKGKDKNMFVHEDSTVDLAVIPGLPSQESYDFKFLPDNFLTTKGDFQNLKIREGSEIFFTGLFLPHLGEHKNYPVVRFGRVALITEENILWEEGVKTELHLVEASSYRGNSGSPVFFYLGAERELGSVTLAAPVLKLAGIMKGCFGETSPIQIIETAKIPVTRSNIGIAAVVPAYKLHEILFSEELKMKRKP